MTLTAFKSEVAKVLGGQNTANNLDLAERAIKASLRDWQAAKEWNFLLKDTAASFRLTLTSWSTGATLTVGSNGLTTGALDHINRNLTVTYVSGANCSLAAGTTVSSYTRSTDGTVATVVLSNSIVNTGAAVSVVIEFTGDIPLIDSVQEYNLPADFSSPHMARTLTTKRRLEYIKYRQWNTLITDHTTTGSVDAYTIYNPRSPLTQNYGTYRLRVFRTPSAADTLHMQYFRILDVDATTVDIPDDYLDMLIDYAQWRFLRLKDTDNERLPAFQEAASSALAKAMSDDEENSEDEQLRWLSQQETFNGSRPLWGNGNFYPTMDF